MYDIKQFKPTLYLLVLIGFTGFAIAAQTAGLWVIAVMLVLANAWLIKTDLFTPLPRYLANMASVVALLYVFMEVRSGQASPILVIGQFLVAMQIIKIWEQRANRDYAQLLVLSLLLMVAAAISTASLVFGLLLIAYLFLSLYCCLLFHLKVETDEARQAMALPDRVSPSTLRHDQRHLPSSMRRLTGLVSVFAVVCAVIVFLFFPRGTGAGLFGQMQWRPKDTLTGFSDQVSFQQVAKITQNNDEIATVKVWKDGQLVQYSGPLLLRGVTHDTYYGASSDNAARFEWKRTGPSPNDERSEELEAGSEFGPHSPVGPVRYRQEIQLNPTGTSVIFAIAGPVSIRPEQLGGVRHFQVRYSPLDATLQTGEPLQQPIKYEVLSSGQLGTEAPSLNRDRPPIDPKIAEYARRPEVSGPGLAEQRAAIATTQPAGLLFQPTPLDDEIAANIEKHLRNTFQYTLDLTPLSRVNGRDPVVAFLYDFKKGHCEYFAGAMTLLCQSLGLEARMVVGFKCDEYNDFGHFYNVRQSHAHAWVEVLTQRGWLTYDPTSGRDADEGRQVSAWQKTKHFFEFLEYTWGNAVIAYNAENRENLINTVDNRLTNTAIASSVAVGGVKGAFDDFGRWLASHVLGPLLIVLGIAMAASVGWFIFERWRLRRRASRIGIESLPASAQMRLVRQLGFYDELLRLLERHDIVRPRHLTPLEFSNSLSFLPSEAYETIGRLTELFYRIRYGQAELAPAQQKRLSGVIDRLAESMPRPPKRVPQPAFLSV
jgi:transglutaminase-like putative cysteine protease